MNMSADSSVPASPDGFVSISGERYYRIAVYDRMPPFLMNIANNTDLWMFISSSGGLTAGRIDPDGAIFPYETVDRLHDGHHHTGPITVAHVLRGPGEDLLWEPFTANSARDYRIERNLYKNVTCNRVIFEEINLDLALTFRYRWAACERFGHVRTASLENHGPSPVSLSLLDGLRNVLPFGAPLALYQQSSSLVDAYKRTDCDQESKLGIFSLSSRILDRAEAAEELKANTVWCCAGSEFGVCLSTESIDAFRRGDPAPKESVLTGRRGNYLVTMRVDLEAGEKRRWHIAADTGLGHAGVSELRKMILQGAGLDKKVETSLARATEDLARIVGSADGKQLTGSETASAHHFANVLFNIMRGGVFAQNYEIEADDLRDFILARNREVSARNGVMLGTLPDMMPSGNLSRLAESSDDPDLERLCYEYLPLYFGRRHGDPSRPWNRFSINVKASGGGRLLSYEGNWRDIFQNWEALGISFPGFLPGIIAKFVNASTVDGFNPYRLMRDGVDWEVADPEDPWSYIGYWGDHQIIYLLKFLESLSRFYPGTLEKLMVREIYSYAEVPYKIKPYGMIREDPHSTIEFDKELDAAIDERVLTLGADGRLVQGADGSVYHVTLFEKLLVPILSKLSNLVPDGGIWMNTQRPEWNDANNALVGKGISMVTLFYLRRHLGFLADVLEGMGDARVPVSAEVADWFENILSILEGERALLKEASINDIERMRLLDLLGGAFSEYRAKVYSLGFSGKREIDTGSVAGFCRVAVDWLEHAVRINRRDDGLYHSYNLLEISSDGGKASVHPLYEMLEGQVAVLGSGEIGPEEAARLLASLFDSDMYREDQRSFMLYPARELPGFMEKNVVPADKALSIPLLRELIDSGDRSIILRDADGIFRFNSDFASASDLASALDAIASDNRWASGVDRHKGEVFDLFEAVFRHSSFTGRSGTMYGYEGLGCIYWHMVSKLLLAAQEIAISAAGDEDCSRFEGRLADFYYRIRGGLGFEKTALEFGAFPTDPYSHTPPHDGAKQPGMTGQVKEEILTRFGELGVAIEGGILGFHPLMLKGAEFLREDRTFRFYDLEGEIRSIDVDEGSLAFTYCQIPVVYELAECDPWIRVSGTDGSSTTMKGCSLDMDQSRAVFDRLGVISRIDVGIPRDCLK